MDELLKTVDAIVSYMAYAGESHQQSGYIPMPLRLACQLTTARKRVIENAGKCLCGGKCK